MTSQPEPAIDPDLPVVDAHDHLLDRVDDVLASLWGRRRLLVDDYADLVDGGHHVVASVAVESRAMYRATGPEHLRVVGQTEFMDGQAAMAASGLYGDTQAITLFGADRVMFESNLPTDGSGAFRTVCNAYQRITSGCSEESEKRAIFAGTAVSVYGLDGIEPARAATA
jgi:predicted TIM-barrel fold metal-dependent hydrolase